MEKWLDLLSIIPEPFRFLILGMVAILTSYFFAKILAGLIIQGFNVELPSDDDNQVGFGLLIVRRFFWTTWSVGTLLILYLYYKP